MNENVGTRIRSLRQSLNLSQSRFGNRIGVSAKTVSAYETGKIIPSYKVLEKISMVYNVGILNLPREQKQNLAQRIRDVENALQEIKIFLD